MNVRVQQINLYQPVAETSSQTFSAAAAATLALVVIGCLLATWGYQLWRVRSLARAVDSLRQQQQQQQTAMAAVDAARELGVSPEQMDARVKELSLEVETHERALQSLRDGSVGQTMGFSTRLAALARHSVGGLWIDRVQFSGTGGAMSLGGAAESPDLIPRYLRGLAAESVLTGVRFDEFVIERPASGTGRTFKFRAQGEAPSMAARNPSP